MLEDSIALEDQGLHPAAHIELYDETNQKTIKVHKPKKVALKRQKVDAHQAFLDSCYPPEKEEETEPPEDTRSLLEKSRDLAKEIKLIVRKTFGGGETTVTCTKGEKVAALKQKIYESSLNIPKE